MGFSFPSVSGAFLERSVSWKSLKFMNSFFNVVLGEQKENTRKKKPQKGYAIGKTGKIEGHKYNQLWLPPLVLYQSTIHWEALTARNVIVGGSTISASGIPKYVHEQERKAFLSLASTCLPCNNDWSYLCVKLCRFAPASQSQDSLNWFICICSSHFWYILPENLTLHIYQRQKQTLCASFSILNTIRKSHGTYN